VASEANVLPARRGVDPPLTSHTAGFFFLFKHRQLSARVHLGLTYAVCDDVHVIFVVGVRSTYIQIRLSKKRVLGCESRRWIRIFYLSAHKNR
jgi:hypothetical protein